MRVRANFGERVLVRVDEIEWVESPMRGVWRKMLDRVGGEVARATTVVRYREGSQFSGHVHEQGEEFLVLEGVFEDEHGEYPAGSYVRNPPGSSHVPGSQEGCVILVKLRQFEMEDQEQVRVRGVWEGEFKCEREGVEQRVLFKRGEECVTVERWGAGVSVEEKMEGGCEVFVWDGEFEEGGEGLNRWDWLRVPQGGVLRANVGKKGARVWMKRGHLRGL